MSHELFGHSDHYKRKNYPNKLTQRIKEQRKERRQNFNNVIFDSLIRVVTEAGTIPTFLVNNYFYLKMLSWAITINCDKKWSNKILWAI